MSVFQHFNLVVISSFCENIEINLCFKTLNYVCTIVFCFNKIFITIICI